MTDKDDKLTPLQKSARAALERLEATRKDRQDFLNSLNPPPWQIGKPIRIRTPKGDSDGSNRKAGTPTHGDTVDATNNSTGRATKDALHHAQIAFYASIFEPPKPRPIPHAGIRAGEIVGYRMWWAVTKGDVTRLCSLAHVCFWKPGVAMTGKLDEQVDGMFAMIYPPIFGGVYAYKDTGKIHDEIAYYARSLAKWRQEFERLGRFPATLGFCAFTHSSTLVSGTIKMWGEVVEHEKGWRAENAVIASLDGKHLDGACDLDALRKVYGV